MENDKELLEWAAKAVGLEVTGADAESGDLRLRGGFFWNPKDDDGDAFRLQVACGLRVEINRTYPTCGYVFPFVDVHGFASRRLLITQIAKTNDDIAEATRLAITRAAAEIGKVMP